MKPLLCILAAVSFLLLNHHPVYARDVVTTEAMDEIKNIIEHKPDVVQEVFTTVIPSSSTLASGEETEDITVEVPSKESYKTLKRDKRMLFSLHWAFKVPFLIAHHFVKKIAGFGTGFMQGIRGGIFG